MESITFELRYTSPQTFRLDCQQQIAMRGLMIRTDMTLAQFSALAVKIIAPDGQEFDLNGEVVQVLPGQGLAIQFVVGNEATVENIIKKCESLPADQESPTSDQEDPQVSQLGQTVPQKGLSATAKRQSLKQQLDAMAVTEKKAACLRGRKDMRMLLIRDRNKTLHPFVIKNPGITLDEIEMIAKMPGINPDVLRTIAKSKEWNRSITVCRNLVRNPKTPMPDALVLLARLPKSDIRALAKTNNVRMPIQQAARKLVLR